MLGSGKYGVVYRCGSGGAVKEMGVGAKSHRAQAYREYVVGMLQSLLVLRDVTPHLPLHFGATAQLWGGRARLRLYMEAFQGTLEQTAPVLLAGSEDAWLSLFFQVWSAVLSLAEVFGVSHNDLYPRNVLVDPTMRSGPVAYEVVGVRYQVPWPFLAVVSDFGVSSGDLLGCPEAPEVAKRLGKVPAPPFFGREAPSKHILEYRDLPPLSRDPYVLLKWAAFPHRSLPTPPPTITSWAREGLDRLDAAPRKTFSPSAAFHASFSLEALRRHRLASLRSSVPEEEVSFALRRKDYNRLMASAAALLRRAGGPKAPEADEGLEVSDTQ